MLGIRVRRFLTTAALAASFVFARDYLTVGGDSARTRWLKDEKVISKANASQIKLLWKTKLLSTPRQMHNLFSPLIVQSLRTPSGVKEVAIVANVSDNLWGLDAKSGEILWPRNSLRSG
jgi:hypothetical protein